MITSQQFSQKISVSCCLISKQIDHKKTISPLKFIILTPLNCGVFLTNKGGIYMRFNLAEPTNNYQYLLPKSSQPRLFPGILSPTKPLNPHRQVHSVSSFSRLVRGNQLHLPVNLDRIARYYWKADSSWHKPCPRHAAGKNKYPGMASRDQRLRLGSANASRLGSWVLPLASV